MLASEALVHKVIRLVLEDIMVEKIKFQPSVQTIITSKLV
jgi:hypothetical protein